MAKTLFKPVQYELSQLLGDIVLGKLAPAAHFVGASTLAGAQEIDRVPSAKIPGDLPAGDYYHVQVTLDGVTYDAYANDLLLKDVWVVPVAQTAPSAAAPPPAAQLLPSPAVTQAPPSLALGAAGQPGGGAGTPTAGPLAPPTTVSTTDLYRFSHLPAMWPTYQGLAPRFPAVPPRLESAGAWANARPSAAARAAIEEQVAMGFLDPALAAPGANVATATARTSRSITTAIRPHTAELTGYEARLASGEVGLLAPAGSNIHGPDYVTAARSATGRFQIRVVDAKSRVTTNAFGKVAETMPETWKVAVDRALQRLNLDNPEIEQAIREAWQQSRSTAPIVRDTIDYSERGQGALSLAGAGASQAPRAAAGSRVFSGALGVAGAGLSGYAFQNDLAHGQWFDAAVDSTSFVSSGLTFGGAVAGSGALSEAGLVIGSFGIGVLIGTGIDYGAQWASEGLFGVDLSPSALIAGQLTMVDNQLTTLWTDPSTPAYTQTLGWKLSEWFE